ncbi:hypothetical protein [Aquamicrobium zhengzhouense]|uniref:Ethyl tert-butyl ether degradation EthD n=1 Tax=Aquamicrobium zhengzhouense TaxID=2781738 RepID=A0ABS0SAP0_9HYPH|nr:hypothetical protein [Aquamicrobium zhengzhouense]MBI1619869.1 hypothetical protein [Aquamicrobium zhengzhouense]
MIIRQALFDGQILTGREQEFRSFVEANLVPLWKQFPGVREVRVLFARERDEGAPSYPMVLSMAFDDEAALAAALEAPVRFESRGVTAQLLTMFEGRVHHHVFEVV